MKKLLILILLFLTGLNTVNASENKKGTIPMKKITQNAIIDKEYNKLK